MRTILVAACLVILAAPALGERHQHGDIIYDLPPGWLPSSFYEAFEAIRYDDPTGLCDPCAIHLRLSAPARGSIEEWLDVMSQELLLPEYHDSVEVISKPRVIEAAPRRVAMTAAILDNAVVVVSFAVEAGSRYQFLAFEGPANDNAALDQSLAFLEAEVRPFFDNVEYVSEGAGSLLPPAKPG